MYNWQLSKKSKPNTCRKHTNIMCSSYLISQTGFLFIKASQHKCWRSVGHQALQPAKDVKLGQYVWKVADRRKNPWCTKTASNLQPSNLRWNAYRSLPGDQDIFSLLFSCIYIHRNPRKWLIIFKYFLWNIVLFIKVLQHKCWRSVGHQALLVSERLN